MDELINKVYEKVKNSLLNGVDEKYHISIEKKYKSYVRSVLEELSKVKSDISKTAESFAIREKQKIDNYSVNERLSHYVSDSNFIKLEELSCIAYKNALKKYNGDTKDIISKEEASNNLELMKNYSENVYDFNKKQANILLSESSVDYYYATTDTNDMSFRLADMANLMQKKAQNSK